MLRRHYVMMGNWAKFGGFAGFIIAILVCSFVWMISYPPLPGFGPKGEHHDCGTTTEQKASAPNKEPSDVVRPSVQGADNDKSQACRDERERLQKSSNERGLTIATWILAYATVLLCCTVAIQAILFIRQLDFMKVGMNDAKVAADAAKKAAESSDLSARAAIALEMPLLRASPSTPVPLKEDAVFLFAPEARVVGAPISQITKFAIIDGLVVHNVGRTGATPVRIKFGTNVADHPEGEPFYTFDKMAEPNSFLPIGTPSTPNGVISPIEYIITNSDDDVGRLRRPGEFFWAYAEISYLDFMDKQHDVRFCWRWERDGTRGWRWIGRSDIPAAYLKKTDH